MKSRRELLFERFLLFVVMFRSFVKRQVKICFFCASDHDKKLFLAMKNKKICLIKAEIIHFV